MMYFMDSEGKDILGEQGMHLGDKSLTLEEVIKYGVKYVYADGDELVLCFNILGMKELDVRSYTFCGDQARTILLNWDTFQKSFNKTTMRTK